MGVTDTDFQIMVFSEEEGENEECKEGGLGLVVVFYFFLEKSFKLIWPTVDICLHLVVATELPFILLSLIIHTFFFSV